MNENLKTAIDAIKQEEREKVARWLEGKHPEDIRLHAGEIGREEMRTIIAIRDWWIRCIRDGEYWDVKYWP